MSSDFNFDNILVSVDDNMIKSLKTCHIIKIHVIQTINCDIQNLFWKIKFNFN